MSWKDDLKELKYKHMEQRTPGAFIASGGRSMKLKPYTDTTANGLQNCIIDYFTYTGQSCTRINTMGTPRKERIEYYGGQHRDKLTFTPSTTRKGTSDLKAIYKGFAIDIEVKIGKDSMKAEQIKEKARIERAGGIYLTVTSFPDFLQQFEPIKKRLDETSILINKTTLNNGSTKGQ